MNREGKKCVLYPRVSTEMQVDGYSLEGQKNSLRRFADREEKRFLAYGRSDPWRLQPLYPGRTEDAPQRYQL